MPDLIPQSRFLRHWDADEDEVIPEVMVALQRTGRPGPKSSSELAQLRATGRKNAGIRPGVKICLTAMWNLL
jgi:hypothetical protein